MEAYNITQEEFKEYLEKYNIIEKIENILYHAYVAGSAKATEIMLAKAKELMTEEQNG